MKTDEEFENNLIVGDEDRVRDKYYSLIKRVEELERDKMTQNCDSENLESMLDALKSHADANADKSDDPTLHKSNIGHWVRSIRREIRRTKNI